MLHKFPIPQKLGDYTTTADLGSAIDTHLILRSNFVMLLEWY